MKDWYRLQPASRTRRRSENGFVGGIESSCVVDEANGEVCLANLGEGR